MAPVVAEIALEYKDTFIVAKLNAINNPKTSLKYQVRGHPTYLVFQDEKVVKRFGGQTPKGEFVQNVLNAIDVEEN
ncbi:hypothetical protein C6499_18550 [Candidatus Poribacteria bacterium]|nr:MAG: hypothetical protein C6499_18550 [Candidatus Poribacteria bacterium]